MTTLTDKELIKEIKERISSLDVRDNIERRAYEIALASLEADPVAYIFKHPAGKLFWALTDESNKEQPDVIPVYAAAPASVCRIMHQSLLLMLTKSLRLRLCATI